MPVIKIVVCYAGTVYKGRVKKYVGDDVRTCDLEDVDTDYLSFIDLNVMLKEKGVNDIATLWVKFYDLNEIFEVKSDSDLMTLVDKLGRRQVVELFVEHAPYTAEEIRTLERDIDRILYTESDESDVDFVPDVEESSDSYDISNECVSSDFREEDDDSDDDLFWEGFRTEQNSTVDDLSGKGIIDDDTDCERQLYSPPGSDTDCEKRNRQPFRMFYEDSDSVNDLGLKLGDAFTDADQFRTALLNFSVQKGFSYDFSHNERTRIAVDCKQKCGWYIRASPCSLTGCFRIKSMNGVHSCVRQYYNKQVTSSWIAKTILPMIKGSADWDPNGIKAYVKKHFHLEVSAQQCYRGKRKALEIIHGESSQQYKKVKNYCEAIMMWNPGSQAIVSAENFFFQRMYVCLDACKRGFIQSCRPLIVVDGCHLKSVYGGQLLCAIGKDGNDNMYPISYAVVEIENEQSWRWFFECLKNDIGLGVDESWTFISDQQKGLLNSLNSVFPNDAHRFCVRHLYGNMKSRFKGRNLKELLWKAAQSTREIDFNFHMSMMERIDRDAYLWLREKNPAQWSRHAFNPRVKSDSLLSNVAESFNHWIGEARDKPILTLCETIRRLLMKRFVLKRDEYKDYRGTICPRIQKKLERFKSMSTDYIVYFDGQGGYEVEHSSGRRFCVNLNDKTCACKAWELTGIPCAHACAAIFYHKDTPEDYVHPYYHIQTFKKAYEHTITAMPGPECWPTNDLPDLQPPVPKALSGRPKKVRRREADEPQNPFQLRRAGYLKKCGSCGSSGHNSTTCKNSVTNPSRAAKAQKEAERARAYRQKLNRAGNASSTENSENQAVASSSQPIRRRSERKEKAAASSSQPEPPRQVSSQTAQTPAFSSQPVRNSGVFGLAEVPATRSRTTATASRLGGTFNLGVASRTRRKLDIIRKKN